MYKNTDKICDGCIDFYYQLAIENPEYFQMLIDDGGTEAARFVNEMMLAAEQED
jgi:hypothetical protein